MFQEHRIIRQGEGWNGMLCVCGITACLRQFNLVWPPSPPTLLPCRQDFAASLPCRPAGVPRLAAQGWNVLGCGWRCLVHLTLRRLNQAETSNPMDMTSRQDHVVFMIHAFNQMTGSVTPIHRPPLDELEQGDEPPLLEGDQVAEADEPPPLEGEEHPGGSRSGA